MLVGEPLRPSPSLEHQHFLPVLSSQPFPRRPPPRYHPRLFLHLSLRLLRRSFQGGPRTPQRNFHPTFHQTQYVKKLFALAAICRIHLRLVQSESQV